MVALTSQENFVLSSWHITGHLGLFLDEDQTLIHEHQDTYEFQSPGKILRASELKKCFLLFLQAPMETVTSNQ